MNAGAGPGRQGLQCAIVGAKCWPRRGHRCRSAHEQNAERSTRRESGMGPPARGLDAASECPPMGEVLGAAAGAEPRRVRSHRRASGVRSPATSARAVCVAWAIVPRCARAGCDAQQSAREREGAAGVRAGCCGWVPGLDALHNRRPRCWAGKRSAAGDAATVACRSAREQHAVRSLVRGAALEAAVGAAFCRSAHERDAERSTRRERGMGPLARGQDAVCCRCCRGGVRCEVTVPGLSAVVERWCRARVR